MVQPKIYRKAHNFPVIFHRGGATGWIGVDVSTPLFEDPSSDSTKFDQRRLGGGSFFFSILRLVLVSLTYNSMISAKGRFPTFQRA